MTPSIERVLNDLHSIKRNDSLRICLAPILVIVSFGGVFLGQARGEDSKKLPTDLALVPPEVQLIVSIQADEYLRRGPEAASLKQLALSHPVVPLWWLKDLQSQTGVQAVDVKRVILFSTKAGDWHAAVTTHKPYDRKKVLAALVSNGVEREAGGKKYVFSEKSSNAVYAVSDRVFLLGMHCDLKALLGRRAAGTRSPALTHALSAVGNGGLLTLYVGRHFIDGPGRTMFNTALAPLANAENWQVTVTPGRSLRIVISAEFKTNDDAAAGTVAAKKLGEMLKSYIALAGKQMPAFLKKQVGMYPGAQQLSTQMDSALRASAEALKTIEIRTRDHRVEVSIDVKTNQPATTAALLLTLMPRARK